MYLNKSQNKKQLCKIQSNIRHFKVLWFQEKVNIFLCSLLKHYPDYHLSSLAEQPTPDVVASPYINCIWSATISTTRGICSYSLTWTTIFSLHLFAMTQQPPSSTLCLPEPQCCFVKAEISFSSSVLNHLFFLSCEFFFCELFKLEVCINTGQQQRCRSQVYKLDRYFFNKQINDFDNLD